MIASLKLAWKGLTVKTQVTFQKQPVYFGEDVKGELTVGVSRPVTIGTIEVELLGASHSECSIGSGEGSYEDVQNHDYLKSLHTIVDARPTGGLAVADTIGFNFEFKLPYGFFPSSDDFVPKSTIQTMYGPVQAPPFVHKVKYSCKVIVKDLTNAVMHSEAIPFRTLAHHNYVGGEVPSQADFAFCIPESGCCCQSQPGQSATIHIVTDKTVYFPGEYIQAKVWVDNTSTNFFELNKTPVHVTFARIINIASSGNFYVAKRHGPNEILCNNRQPFVDKIATLRKTGEHSQLSFFVPEDAVPTFDYVMGCASHWVYVITVIIPNGNLPYHYSLVVVVNSKAPSSLLMYPPVALPAPTDRGNGSRSNIKSGTIHSAGLWSAPASNAAPGQVNLEMVAPTFAPTGTAAYQPVMTDEIKR